jgi:hypothetical protein
MCYMTIVVSKCLSFNDKYLRDDDYSVIDTLILGALIPWSAGQKFTRNFNA